MPRSWLVLVCACAAGVAAGAVPRPPARAIVRGAVDLVPAADPFPIRRLRGPADRLPDLLKELEPGPVVRLPRAEFESKVRAAGRAELQRNSGPRVVDATYTAELDGGDLTGTAELGVLNASGARAFLPLDPLRLAVRDAIWAGGGDAVLAMLPAAGPNTCASAVWVERDGRSTLRFRWSLTGVTEPGERRFELRVPPAPVAALDLDLPAGQVPTAAADVLLTGPFDVPGKPARRAWRLRFGGRAKLEFAVRAGGAPSVGAAAALVAKYDLAPGQLAAAFEYDLRPARGPVGEWTFAADPGLRITEVIANNRAGWTVDPPLTPGGPRLVRVSLRQPGPGGKVLISAVAPLSDGPLPAVRPVGAVVEGEAVELRVTPGLKVESWSPGDYRLTGAADAGRVLTLVGTLLPPGASEPFRRMPSVRTVAPEAEFATLERLDWRPGTERSTLAARVRVRVSRGPLFQLVVRPPSGFALDRDAPGAEELVAYVGTSTQAGQAVEFARPLLAGQQAELRLEFRGPGVKSGARVPFPAFAVANATERDGWLSVSADPAFAVRVAPGAGALPAGLWGWLTADPPADARAVYLFRAKEPDGFATLTRARGAVTARATVTLDTAGDRWAAVTRFDIAATGGVLPTVAVFVPGASADGRTWKLLDPTNTVVDATPVPPEFLAALPLFAPVDTRAAVGGTFWVLRFARPLAGAAALETVEVGPPASDSELSLSVPRLLGAEQTTRAAVAPALVGRADVNLMGDSLRVVALPRGVSDVRRGAVSGAYLLTAVRGPGDALVAFGGTVHDAAGGTLPVELPPGAEVRGVCVAGRWLNPAACAVSGALRVPVPAGTATRFEVRYRLPAAAGWPTRRVASPVPSVPGAPPVRRWWTFAPGVLPGWPARPWDATADEPPLLGGPLAGAPALVIQSDDEWVRVGAVQAADAVACGLAALLAACGLVVARRRRARGAVVLASAVVIAIAAAEVGPPWWARAAWPALGAAVVALAWALVGIGVRGRVVPGVAALAAGFALCAVAARAEPPAPATVLVMPGADGAEEVFAPRALLDRLGALARPPVPAPVVAAAAYEVRADGGGGAHVTARFVVHAFGASDNVVSLALPDARLERVTVDGAAAFPAARPGGCTVAVGGPGRHAVEVRFAAAVAAAGADREVRFAVLEAADARLTAVLPGEARQPQAVGRVGRQTAGAAGARTTLDADLGPVKAVHLRWREGADGAATVKVREACVWDMAEAGATLTAAYLVRVEQGAVAGLRFDVPAELEVLRVAVRTTEPAAAPLALKDWTLADAKRGTRALRLDFQGPAAGRFLVVLECAPRAPLTRHPVLRFPRVAFNGVKGESDAVYGLRAAGVTVDEVGRSGVIDFPAEALREFDAIPELKLAPNAPVRAFRPAPGTTAELRPTLRAAEPPAVRTATAWRVGPRRADGTGTVSWTARDTLAFVEFTLPGVKVLEVRGAEVAGWNQAGGRVQVWLLAGVRKGVIEWTGTTALVPPNKPVPNPLPFEPVHPKVAHARLAGDDVRVRPVDGWAARADHARGWQAATAPAGELRFHTDLPNAPPLRVRLVPEP